MYSEDINDDGIIEIGVSTQPLGADDLPHVTGKFYKGRSKLSGSGLGLAICKEIVELHGGRLTVHSLPGKGTSITVELPEAAAVPGET